MPPPHVANMDRSSAGSHDRDAAAARRMEVREGYTQLSASSSPARPVPPGLTSAAGTMSQDNLDVQSMLQNQDMGTGGPAILPARRLASVPMSVSSEQSDLMAPPPQYQSSLLT
jgi:hypothetical protein